jgi:hypothetical protein
MKAITLPTNRMNSTTINIPTQPANAHTIAARLEAVLPLNRLLPQPAWPPKYLPAQWFGDDAETGTAAPNPGFVV